MKKFWALAAASVLCVSMAGCGKEKVEEAAKEAEKTVETAKEEVKEEAEKAEEKVEEKVEEVKEGAESLVEDRDYDFVNGGVGVRLPEGFTAEQYSGNTSIIRTDNDAGTLIFGKAFISVDENNDFYGQGYEKADSEGVEAADIDPFKAGNYNWIGYTFDTMLFGDYWHYVNLTTEEAKDGERLSVLLHSGTGDEEWYGVDSEEIQYILANMDFVEE